MYIGHSHNYTNNQELAKHNEMLSKTVKTMIMMKINVECRL